VLLDIGGLEPGTGYDQLTVTGRALLGGVLGVRLAEGFRPAWTNTFAVVTWGWRDGEFVNAPNGNRIAANGGGSFRLWYQPGGLELSDYQRDNDNDGIDDLWAMTYFGRTPLSRDEKLADYDGDGASNQDEAVAGTHPKEASSVLKLEAIRLGTGKFSLRFPCVMGKRYRVWHADNAMDWREMPAPDFIYPAPGYAELVDDGSQTGPEPGWASARFYRISVE
jgi:hypothetical protein